MSPPLLAMQDVCAGYGPSTVLFDVSLAIAPGECVGLLGRNGVGKTTTMRAVMGLTPARAGRVTWKGDDITRRPPNRNARAGIGFVPEDRRVFAELTVWENLDVGARRCRDGALRWTLERVLAMFPKLGDLLDRKGGLLSGGEQQMLTIARTLMGNPDLLLLDEPSEGLAPIVVEHLHSQVAALKREGLTILLAEQNLDFVLGLSDRVYILEKGRVVFHGTPADVRADPHLREQYLTV
ncbi:MAG TPA: ABC transporter ATP-binding protein [Azospirillum sp.]|nr:ABC transporter ATP-binding protein [Azospirillum sp.]